MAVWYQQAGVAMLLAAPSSLHKVWKENNEKGFEAELERLGLTEEAKVEALKSMADLRANVEFIHATSIVLRDKMWAGSEPHPTDSDAVKIMAALRRLDEAW
jgi:hypothetical protein